MSDKVFNLVQCDRCGLNFINPRPNEEEIAPFYSTEYYSCQAGSLERFYSSFLNSIVGRSILRNTERGKLLDIGCGSGSFLLAMRGKGYDVYGVDTSEDACKLAKEKVGRNIFNGELKQFSFPDNYFDVATMWHVLEHMPNPIQELGEVSRILQSKGILILEVPNIGSLGFKLFGENWPHLDVPRHVCHYSKETLEKLLDKTGFRPFKAVYPLLSFPLSLFISFSNCLGYRMRIKNTLIRRGALLVFSPILIIMTVLLRLISHFFGSGELIRIYCRKEKGATS